MKSLSGAKREKKGGAGYGAAETTSPWRHEVKGPAGCPRHAVQSRFCKPS